MKKSEKIDILLATYNGEKYLKEQIESILNQTYSNFRLVISDDKSTDNTLAILEEYEKKDDRIIVYKQEKNLGYIKNFEFLLTKVENEIYMLSDQDDYWKPEKVGKTYLKLKQENADLVFTDLEVVDQELQTIETSFNNYMLLSRKINKFKDYRMQYLYNCITGCTLMSKKKYIKDALPLPTSSKHMLHDYWIGIVVALKGKIAYLPEQTIKYRQHGNNQIGTDKLSHKFTELQQVRELFIDVKLGIFGAYVDNPSIFPENLQNQNKKVLSYFQNIQNKKYVNFKGWTTFHKIYKYETIRYYLINFLIMNFPIIATPMFKLRNFAKKISMKKILVKIYKMIFKYTPQEKYDLEENENYQKWIENNEPKENELQKQRETKLEKMPKISIIVPLYNTPEQYFIELLESVTKQTYSNWELCLADGSPEKQEYLDGLLELLGEKVKYKFLNSNKGISGNSNEALKLATGEYIALLDHDDIIPEFALYEIVKTINENPKADFIYTDEDKMLETKDKRISPHFKQDFAIDTLRSYNYICHFSIIKKELMDKLQGFNSEFDGSQDYDLILRATEQAEQIVHIPKILYNWRINANSVASGASAKPYAYVAAKKAILASIERSGIQGAKVEDSRIMGLYKITYPVKGQPKVSIIIPNKDHKKELETCVQSIEKSTYSNYEIIIVENNSTSKEIFKYYEKIKSDKIKIETYNQQEFNYSKLNNFGASKANGEYYVFLNNDTKIITTNWLETIIGNCQREEIGAIGAKLIYKNKRIQHAGVVLNLTGTAGHVNLNMKENNPGYFGRIMIQQNVSAVTGALLGISKKVFDEIKGFDETFPIAYNDVDLCLKILDLGKLITYNPYIEAYHFESKSRGYDNTEEKRNRLAKEEEKIKLKWSKYFETTDKYFNPNLRTDTPNMRVKWEG